MAPKISNDILDAPLNVLKNNGTIVHILKAEIMDIDLLVDNSLGSGVVSYNEIEDFEDLDQDGVTILASGRKIIMQDLIEADLTTSGKASHFIITDGITKIYLCQSLLTEKDTIGGNKFNLSACTIKVYDPVDPII